MQRKTMFIAGGAVAVAAIAAGTGIGLAGDVGDDDEPLTGATYDRAVAAALAETGGGTVTETEIGDDGAAFSVEVRLEDGSQPRDQPGRRLQCHRERTRRRRSRRHRRTRRRLTSDV